MKCALLLNIRGGELFDRVIEDEFVLTEKACVCFMRQVLEGVSFIHSKHILHLDLKPENILCPTKTGNRIKIIDFGLARIHEPHKKLQVLFGTPEFVAPEVVNFEPISFATDMWAVGVITYVLVSGLSPFMGDTDLETMANVTIAEYDYEDEAFSNISDQAKDFVDQLLIKKKEDRLTADACLKHSWIKSIPAAKNLKKNKKNLKNVSKNNNYYLFDASNKTMSVASTQDVINPGDEDEWEWEDEALESENQTTNAESYFGQRNNPEPKISHQEVQDRVKKILEKLAQRDKEAKDKKRRSEDCSANSITTPTDQGTTTIETLTLLLPPVSTPLTKTTTTTTMFSSRPASSGTNNSSSSSDLQDRGAEMDFYQTSPAVKSANEILVSSTEYDLQDRGALKDFYQT